jgi:hypothetical protein
MPETIGQQLKKARLARNLTLVQAVEATHIRAYYLEAIDDDNFEALPSPVQARGFLRLYAYFLNFSLDELIEMLDIAHVLGKQVRALSLGERIQSVRFFDDRAFVVTFQQVDPLLALDFSDPKALSSALSSIAGSYSTYVFAVGLVAAAFLALVVISLGSSWAMVDTMAWEKRSFMWVYLLESLPAVAIPILYPEPLSLVLGLMVVFVFVLVGPGILLGLLGSDSRIMGRYTSDRRWGFAYWVCLATVVGFGFAALATAV